MPIFNDFSENGKLLSTREEKLTKFNLSRYFEEHGQQKIEGYVDAMNDLITELDKIIYSRFENNPGPNSAGYVKKEIVKLFEERREFISIAQSFLSSDKQNNFSPE